MTFCADDLTVRLAHPHEIGWLLHEHYLHKWPAVATAIIGLCRRDVPRGCIVFAEAPRETSVRYGGRAWELARLWVHDDEPRNTESWFKRYARRSQVPSGRPVERIARTSKARYVMPLS